MKKMTASKSGKGMKKVLILYEEKDNLFVKKYRSGINKKERNIIERTNDNMWFFFLVLLNIIGTISFINSAEFVKKKFVHLKIFP